MTDKNHQGPMSDQDGQSKIQALRDTIQEGIDSGIAEDFDPDEFLAQLKASRTKNS